ncbi:MAG: DUF11 domain-containing protein [Phycisphaerales bacterium]|nr:DUF11 domain-containing protein [Phycisphaerales bacterium]MCB9863162.1 DUF11 domain-containing protein [Phycisphaerales bacterium]
MLGIRRSVACIAGLALAVSATAVQAQLVVGPLNGTESLYYLDVSTNPAGVSVILDLEDTDIVADGIYGVSVDNANRTIYFNVGDFPLSELYSVHYDDLALDFSGHLRPRKVADLRFSDNQILNGLAFDPNTGTLYAVDDFQSTTGGGPEGIYSINLATGVTTLVVDLSVGSSSNWQIRGIDFNPVDNLLYAINIDSTPNGIGLFSIDVNGAGTITPVVALTGTNKTGLAIGDNKAYIVPDDPGDIEVYNLTTMSFETPITGTPWLGSQLDNGAGWAPDFPATGPLPGANFCTDITADVAAGLEVEAGSGQINYTVTTANCGPDNAASGSYTIVLSGSAAATATISNLVSSSGLAVEGPTGTITATLTPMPFASSDTITFTVTVGDPGDLAVTVDWNPDMGSTDPYLGNNTASIAHSVRVFPAIHTIFTSEPGYPGSTAPTIGGNFSSFVQYARSPDGRYITFWADTDLASSDQALFLGDNDVYAAIVQEDVTDLGGGETVDFPSTLSDTKASVNNAGDVAFSNNTNGSSTSDEVIAVSNSSGTAFTVIAREGNAIPALAGQNYGTDLQSPNITAAGTVGFMNATTAGKLLLENGTIAVMEADVTIPGNQAGGGMETWDNTDTEAFWTDAVGSSWLVTGDLNGSTTTEDILVVDGNVVLQKGFGVTGLTGTIPTFSSTAGVIEAKMESNGDWFVRGTTSDADQDFLLKGHGGSYVVAEKWGDEIVSGTGEHWSDSFGTESWSRTFISVAGNNQGDYIVTGRTDNANAGRNTVAVLVRAEDGTREVVLREGDPVDLDGNGVFDDNIWVRFFEEGDALLMDNGLAYLEIDITNVPPGTATGTSIGEAFVRLPVNTSPVPTGADVLVTKVADTTFVDRVGNAITYTVNVCNLGPDDALNVMMNDTLPAEVMFSSATNGATESGGVVSANIGTLAAFACESFDITVVTIAEGMPTNTATATSSTSDPDAGNNSGSVSVTIENQVDVGVTKIDNGGAAVGVNYDYTVTVTNAGPADATNVVVSDNLPNEVSYVSSSLTDTNADPDIVDVTIPMIPAGGQVVYTITVTANVQALVENNISIVSLNEVDTNPANDSFLLETINGDVANLQITKADSGLTRLGDDITYTIDVTNLGPGPANNVLVTETLPAGATLVSVSVPYVENTPGILEISYASILNGASEPITIVLTPLTAGTYVNTVTVTSDEIDPDDGNNTAITVTRVGDFRDIQLIYSEISGDPTAVVPGALDESGLPVFAEFDTIGELKVSPDGSAWWLAGGSNQSTSFDDVIIVGGGITGSVIMQQGQPVPGSVDGEIWSFLSTDGDAGFNNNNDVAFAPRATGGSTSLDDEKIVTYINGVLSVPYKQGDTISGALTLGDVPAPTAALGNSMGMVRLLDNNSVRYRVSPVSNVNAAYYPIIGEDLAVFIQCGATAIDGARWDDIVSNGTTDVFDSTPDGNHYIAIGNDDGPTTTDGICVYDGVVQLREGSTVGSLGPIANLFTTRLVASGDWFCRGDDAAGDDFVVRNGVVIAQTGDSLIGGAEIWGNSIGEMDGNRVGDYIVGGSTSEPDSNYDTVLVMNGDTLVLREGDPIDVDGNGQFDDNVFIGSFQPNDTFITDDRLVLALVTLRNDGGSSLGDAFIRVQLPTGCPTIAGDVDGDGDGDGDDVQGAVICILTNGASGGACECIDYDNSGTPDVGDIAAFVADLLDN